MGDIKMGKLSLQSDSRQKMKRNILTTCEDAEMQCHRGSPPTRRGINAKLNAQKFTKEIQ